MTTLLKDIFFTPAFFEKLCAALKKEYKDFDTKKFLKLLYDDEWKLRELKQRMRHATFCLHKTLPKDYKKTLKILMTIADQAESFDAMLFPDYVEVYGLEDWAASIPALEYFTRFGSSEFAVRPFLKERLEFVMGKMLEWSKSDNHHVRRFSSEGCRPGLPWAMAVPELKKDPSLILPILENLKKDESEYVRKSVANNLNDISKDHPELVLKIAKKWLGKHSHTDWIVKRALRTLLKKGDQRAMELFGYGDSSAVNIKNLSIKKETIRLGGELNFSFEVVPADNGKLRVEYGIDYVKANGKTSRKVFMVSENEFTKEKAAAFSKKLSFKDLTTRKHYPGEHTLTIIVNGTEKESKNFSVTN